MVKVSPVFSNPSESYFGYRDPKTKTVTVVYNDKNIRDEEMEFVFKADGSATATSCAWGLKTKLPPGTFTDVIMNLPETEKVNAEIARDLASMYRSNPDKEYVKSSF